MKKKKKNRKRLQFKEKKKAEKMAVEGNSMQKIAKRIVIGEENKIGR